MSGQPNAGVMPAASDRTQNLVELCMIQGPLQWRMLTETPTIQDGWLVLPDRPGFGIELATNVGDTYPYVEGSYAVLVERDPA